MDQFCLQKQKSIYLSLSFSGVHRLLPSPPDWLVLSILVWDFSFSPWFHTSSYSIVNCLCSMNVWDLHYTKYLLTESSKMCLCVLLTPSLSLSHSEGQHDVTDQWFPAQSAEHITTTHQCLSRLSLSTMAWFFKWIIIKISFWADVWTHLVFGPYWELKWFHLPSRK